MGKPHPSFEKRRREQKKREKRAEKARRKAERDAAKKLGPSDQVDADEPPEGPEESAESPD